MNENFIQILTLRVECNVDHYVQKVMSKSMSNLITRQENKSFKAARPGDVGRSTTNPSELWISLGWQISLVRLKGKCSKNVDRSRTTGRQKITRTYRCCLSQWSGCKHWNGFIVMKPAPNEEWILTEKIARRNIWPKSTLKLTHPHQHQSYGSRPWNSRNLTFNL